MVRLNQKSAVMFVKNHQTTSLLCLVALFAFGIILIDGCVDQQSTAEEHHLALDSSLEDLIRHGAYLVEIMGCNDCHSPKTMGTNGPEIISAMQLSGYPADRPIIEVKDSLLEQGFAVFYPDLTAAAGPWGMSFAANLTSDETGIGNWSLAQFTRALKHGKFKGLKTSRDLLPPMPVSELSKP